MAGPWLFSPLDHMLPSVSPRAGPRPDTQEHFCVLWRNECFRDMWILPSAGRVHSPAGSTSCSSRTSWRAPLREVGVGPHLHHQGLLMRALDHGQDSVQLLSGHVVWKSQGMVSTQVPAEDGQQQMTTSVPSNQPSLDSGGVPEHPLVPGVAYGGRESSENLMKAQAPLLRKIHRIQHSEVRGVGGSPSQTLG